MLVCVYLISRQHTLVKWCSHEEIYLLTAMPPSTPCFQGSRVWLATIVTNAGLHPSDLPPISPHWVCLCAGGWVMRWRGRCVCVYAYFCACMWVICTTAGILRGFHCKSCRVQNTLMDPNKNPFQSRLSNNNVWGWESTWWPFCSTKMARKLLTPKHHAGIPTV